MNKSFLKRADLGEGERNEGGLTRATDLSGRDKSGRSRKDPNSLELHNFDLDFILLNRWRASLGQGGSVG